MALFTDWFLPKLIGYNTNAQERAMLETTFDTLVTSALAQPQVLVHRDYHSRNIIYREAAPLGVIDFQDGVVGPITYDLVSLLRDCYVAWPQSQVETWALDYMAQAKAFNLLIADVDAVTFMRWFDLMGLQRHIKVLGIFARLSLRDGKDRYLNDLPLVIAYVRYVAKKHPELSPFFVWFEEVVVPRAQACDWFHSVDIHL